MKISQHWVSAVNCMSYTVTMTGVFMRSYERYNQHWISAVNCVSYTLTKTGVQLVFAASVKGVAYMVSRRARW